MVRGSRKKGGMSFAKDKKQAIMAIFVIVLFAITSIRTAIIMYMENQPITPIVETSPNTNSPISSENPEDINISDITTENTEQNLAQDTEDIYSKTVKLKENLTKDISPLTSAENDIEIISKKKTNTKKVAITVVDSMRANPFLPSKENIEKGSLPFLTPPPELNQTDEDINKLLTTTVSGIMYDPYNPSAIINLEGTDYLAKKGDIINGYKVLAINKNQVYIQLGQNTYKAGVGQLFSKENLSSNTVANLNKKFGGNNNISITIKKRI